MQHAWKDTKLQGPPVTPIPPATPTHPPRLARPACPPHLPKITLPPFIKLCWAVLSPSPLHARKEQFCSQSEK